MKVKRRSALRLTLSSPKFCRILETVSRKVTTSGVPLIMVTTTWSFSQSSNVFFNQWGSDVGAWSDVNSKLSKAHSGPCQTSKMQLFAKNKKMLKSLNTFYKKVPLNILVKSHILYVWWSPKCATETNYKLGSSLYQAIINTDCLNSETICILSYKYSTMYEQLHWLKTNYFL